MIKHNAWSIIYIYIYYRELGSGVFIDKEYNETKRSYSSHEHERVLE